MFFVQEWGWVLVFRFRLHGSGEYFGTQNINSRFLSLSLLCLTSSLLSHTRTIPADTQPGREPRLMQRWIEDADSSEPRLSSKKTVVNAGSREDHDLGDEVRDSGFFSGFL